MVNNKINRRFRLKSNVALHKRWSWFWPTSAGHWLLFGLISALMILFWSKLAWAEPSGETESIMPKHHIEQQLDFAAGLERNRTLGDRWTLWGIYQLEYDTQYRLQTGLSYNTASGYINALFVELGYEKINNSKYSARLKFLGNQYGEYSKAANSIIPYMHWDNSLYFIDAGFNYRFLNVNETQLWNIFYYQTEVFELIPYYQFGLKVSMKDNHSTIAIALKNFDEMYAGNIGAYRLHFNYRYTINDKITAFGNLDFWQSGGIVMTNTYYKTGIYGGIEVKL
jgi:hypothetical protein